MDDRKIGWGFFSVVREGSRRTRRRGRSGEPSRPSNTASCFVFRDKVIMIGACRLRKLEAIHLLRFNASLTKALKEHGTVGRTLIACRNVVGDHNGGASGETMACGNLRVSEHQHTMNVVELELTWTSRQRHLKSGGPGSTGRPKSISVPGTRGRLQHAPGRYA